MLFVNRCRLAQKRTLVVGSSLVWRVDRRKPCKCETFETPVEVDVVEGGGGGGITIIDLRILESTTASPMLLLAGLIELFAALRKALVMPLSLRAGTEILWFGGHLRAKRVCSTISLMLYSSE